LSITVALTTIAQIIVVERYIELT